jgi:hypothetical protein
MNNAPLLSTYFVISGRDFDTDKCSESLGLEPSVIWRQRLELLKSRDDLANTEWRIGFDKRPLYSLDEAVREVLDVIWPARDRIRAFLSSSGGLEAILACSVNIQVDRPEYCVSPITMEKLAELHCELCLDIFDYSD